MGTLSRCGYMSSEECGYKEGMCAHRIGYKLNFGTLRGPSPRRHRTGTITVPYILDDNCSIISRPRPKLFVFNVWLGPASIHNRVLSDADAGIVLILS